MQHRLVLRLSLCLFATTFVVFSQVVRHDFLSYDDSGYVTENRIVSRGLSAAGWCWAWSTVHCSNWHPLTWLSHMLDCQLYGLTRPGGHHLTSLLLHSANVLLLFHVLRWLTRETWRPAFVAALFALHPLHVESVAWIAERKDVLSTFFGLLALGAYARYVESPRVGRYLLILFFFALSLLAKPMLVTFPCVLLLLDYWPLRRFPPPQPSPARREGPSSPFPLAGEGWGGGLLLEKLPLFVLAGASCVVTFLAQLRDAVVPIDQLPFSGRVCNAVAAYVGYLEKTFWPVDLALFYPHRGTRMSAWQILAPALILLLLTVLAIGLRRRRPALLVGWLWYLGTLVPVIGLVQVGLQSMADRYTYFPLIGIFIALAWAIPSGLAARRAGRAVLAVTGLGVLAACSVLTWSQLRHWQNEGTVWKHTLDATRNNPLAHFSLGTYLYNHGQVDEAEEQLKRAITLAPRYDQALNNLGTCWLRQGKVDQALELFARSVASDPKTGVYHNNLGLAQVRKGTLSLARDSFRQAVALAPETAEHHCNLAFVLAEFGQSEEAQAAYAEGLRRDPNWPLRANRLARELLETPIPKFRCPDEAFLLARQTCAATMRQDPEMLATLAEACFATGKAPDAVAVGQEALDRATAQENKKLAARLRAELRRYRVADRRETSRAERARE